MTALRVKNILGAALYFVRNIIMARKLDVIDHKEYAGLIFRGYSDSDADSVSKIYSQLNDGAVFSFVQRCLYKYIGKRCLFVVEQVNEVGLKQIVAMNMYYVNSKDIQENTIHEGFIAVVPQLNGRGIATEMRRMAIQHFKVAGFSGISTRISLSNTASLNSAKKIGFIPREVYLDPVAGESRYYMVCKF